MGILDNFISFVLQFNQDTTTTNYLKIIAFSKKSLEKILNPKRNMNYYFRSQNNSSDCGMIARKPKKSLKWADHNQEKPLQQIRFIDIVGKGKKLPRNNNNNNIISKNNLQNINKPNVIVNKCQVRTCPYFGQYHQSNSMRQTAV